MSTHYCGAKTKAGKACKAVAVKRGLCAFHADPQRAAQLGRKGGRKNRRYLPQGEVNPVPPPRTAREVKDLLAETLADIHAGRREPKVASVMAYVGTALLNAIKTAEMEERIASLERASKRE
jgi:general stress protein YciG